MSLAKTALLAMTVALVALSGCAYSRMKLSLDLYKESPTVPRPLTQEQLARHLKDLDVLSANAEQLANDRKRLARELFELNQAINDLAAKAVAGPEAQADQDAARRGASFLEAHENALAAKAEQVRRLAAAARASINSYSDRLETRHKPAASAKARKPKNGAGDPGTSAGDAQATAAQQPQPASRADVARRLEDVAASARELSQPLGTDFERWLPAQWDRVINNTSSQVLSKQLTPQRAVQLEPAFADLRQKATHLSDTINELSERGRAFGQDARQRLRVAGARQAAQPGAMQQTVQAIASAATAVPTSLGWGDRGASALGDLLASTDLMFSQIDRLQDPADPVWRTVASKKNRKKWENTFAETYFFAEGNSSTVIVRDTPISFRVQNGRNNPAALVKGQLEVSRALAGAAIAVAGAASGVPLPSLPKSGGGTAGGGGAPAGGGANTGGGGAEGDGQALARRQATVEAEARQRRTALRNLARTLSDLREELIALPRDEPEKPETATKRKAILSRLQSTLSAHQAFFKEPAPATP
jgi:hypothetical protein